MVRLRSVIIGTALMACAVVAAGAALAYRLIELALDAIMPAAPRPLFSLPGLPSVAQAAPLAYTGHPGERHEAAVPRRSAARHI